MSIPPAQKRVATSRKPDPATFNTVVAHAKIQSIRLVGTKLVIKPAALSTRRSAWKFEVSDELEDWHCDNEAQSLRGEFGYSAVCMHDRSRIITVKAQYLATFALSAACDDEAARHYLERVGRFMCYPYFRAIFATLTEQSGLQLPPLPIIADQPRLVQPPALGKDG